MANASNRKWKTKGTAGHSFMWPAVLIGCLEAFSASAASTISAATAGEVLARAVFTWLGFVHSEGAAVHLVTIQGGNGCLRLLIRTHLDESESLAAAGFPVADDL